MTLAILIHVLAAVIWVGGMFFAHQCLRPVAASLLDPSMRLPLWVQVFNRFFPYVWIAVIALPLTGYWITFHLYGGMATAPLYIHAMNGLGTLMIVIYMYVFFVPYKRLKQAVAEQNWPLGGKSLARIRVMVGINLALGLLVVAIASGGRFLAV